MESLARRDANRLAGGDLGDGRASLLARKWKFEIQFGIPRTGDSLSVTQLNSCFWVAVRWTPSKNLPANASNRKSCALKRLSTTPYFTNWARQRIEINPSLALASRDLNSGLTVPNSWNMINAFPKRIQPAADCNNSSHSSNSSSTQT